MTLPFAVAAGSVPGRAHVIAGKPNQDAWYWVQTERMVAAVVCDGCGSGRQSEVGSQFGARLIVGALERHLAPLMAAGAVAEPDETAFGCALEVVRQDVLDRLRDLVSAMSGELARIVCDYFLFTAVGLAAGADYTVIFSIGDGVWGANGMVSQLGPFANNAPPYLAYDLLPDGRNSFDTDALRFQIRQILPTAAVESLVIGTDGVADLIAAQEKYVPGTDEPVGKLDQFWREERFFANPDALRRRLVRLSRRVAQDTALLSDDTTLVVVRRLPGSEDH